MPNKNKTEKVIILDRSGSMIACKADMEGGLNTYIESQRSAPGEVTVTYITFDTVVDTVLENVPISMVGKLKLVPRGGTALLDAIGQTLNKVGNRLSKTPENDRPGLVDVIVITDGGENSSREFNNDQIKQMITTQENEFNWKFTYLGANQDAFGIGGSLGFNVKSTSNYNTSKSDQLWKNVNSRSMRMHEDMTKFGLVQACSDSYTKEEVESMV